MIASDPGTLMKSPETNVSSKKCIRKEVSLLPNSQRYGIEILSQKRISYVLMEFGKFRINSVHFNEFIKIPIL